MKKVIFMGGVVLFAAMLMVAGCGTTGSAVGGSGGKGNRTPDADGNVRFKNEAGMDSDIFVFGKYVKTVPSGELGFLLNVPNVQQNGTPVKFEVYDSKANAGNFDSPKAEARYRVFTQPVYPASDKERIRNIILVRNPDDSPLPADINYQDMVVEFSYPFEIPQIGDVAAEVFVGQVNSRTTLLSMAPGDKSITIPMKPGFNQFTVMYYVSNNNKEYKFYYPDWSKEDQAQAALVAFDATDLNPSYQIRPVQSIGKVSWIYPKDNQAQLNIKNKSSKAAVINARSLAVGGRSGLIESSEFSIGGRAGSSSLSVGSPMTSFTLKPGTYRFTANNPIPGNAPLDMIDEMIIDAGNTYYWFITDSGSTIQQKKGDASKDLSQAMIQNWKISSNVPNADVKLYVESSTNDVKTGSIEIGKTDSKGSFTMTSAVNSLLPGLTYENAVKVMVKINVAKSGYVDQTQAINALTLLQAGADFAPLPFNLAQEATPETKGAVYKIENVNFYISN